MPTSASNGVIERENFSVEGQVRVLKDAFDVRLGKKVPSDLCGFGLARGVRRGADQPRRGRPRRQDRVRAAQGEAVEVVRARVL